MRKKMKNLRMIGLQYGMITVMLQRTLLVVTLLLSATTQACQVPVFRYALERWQPAPYLLRMPSGSALPQAQEPVNLELETDPALTRLELHYPAKKHEDRTKMIWNAAATAENLRAIYSSPARRELRARLLRGQSTVWLLVESGDASKDEAAALTLNKALDNATKTLRLPTGVLTREQLKDPAKKHENADVLQSELPLKIEFTVLHVKRSDPAEAVLLAMLTHLESDLADYTGEPMAFPIFGRGRVLEPLIGKGIHEANVLEQSTYLCGACSCEVKELNPGMDLLLAVDWEPVDTTPKLEIVRAAPQIDQPEPKTVGIIVCSLGLVAAAIWCLRRRL